MNDLIEALNNRITLLEKQDMMPDLVREIEVAVMRIEQLERENESLWQTHINVANELGVDTEKARNTDGKPSAVYLTYIQKLKQELDELAAHVEKLNIAFAKFEKRHEEIEYEDNTGVFFESQDFDDLTDAFVKPPQASLAEVKVKVARNAFLTGVNWWAGVCAKELQGTAGYTPTPEQAAKQYATKIRNGDQ